MFKFVSLPLMLLVSVGSALCQPALDPGLARLVEAKMDQAGVTGLSVALVDEQRIVGAQGFGWADRERQLRAVPDTVYRAGSITKLFTGLAVMQLAERGQVDIERPLREALPGFSMQRPEGGVADVSPRLLLSHHSGLPSDRLAGMWADDPDSFSSLVGALRDEHLAAPPGTLFSYSNLGYSLLGHLVETVAGEGYSQYVQRELLEPLGMERSYVDVRLHADEGSARGHLRGTPMAEPALRDTPAGGLNTTALDLGRFAQAMLAGGAHGDRRIIAADTLATMLREQPAPPLDFDTRIGLAWLSTRHERLGRLNGHGGSTFLFHSSLLLAPERGVAAVVLSNSAEAAGVVDEIALLLLEAHAGTTADPAPAATLRTPAAPPQRELLERMSGEYAATVGLIRVQRKRKKLKVEIDGSSLSLVPEDDGLFYLRAKMLGLIPVDLGPFGDIGFSLERIDGRQILVATKHHERSLFAERILPVEIPDSWRGRQGSYRHEGSESITAKARLGVVDDLLRLDMHYNFPGLPHDDGPWIAALAPAGDRRAVIRGLGRNLGDSVYVVERNGRDCLRYSGLTLCRFE